MVIYLDYFFFDILVFTYTKIEQRETHAYARAGGSTPVETNEIKTNIFRESGRVRDPWMDPGNGS